MPPKHLLKARDIFFLNKVSVDLREHKENLDVEGVIEYIKRLYCEAKNSKDMSVKRVSKIFGHVFWEVIVWYVHEFSLKTSGQKVLSLDSRLDTILELIGAKFGGLMSNFELLSLIENSISNEQSAQIYLQIRELISTRLA